MTKIKIMDESLANKIAAGEVVEKTMNVVKELVENSIDAGSTEIRIELVDSGVKQMKVMDNGQGMSEDDALLAFSRHATSKLDRLEDLFHIHSLGFRGEALPSIASVSNIEMKTSNGSTGTYIELLGGTIQKVEKSDLRQGTSITVTDLFYNTPVRLKYLKNLYAELANIVSYVHKMALSYPMIRFTLSNNDKLLFQTDGTNNLLKVIHEIYGLEVSKKMIKVQNENDDYHIEGFISYPEIAKKTRNVITTLVNGRVIKNNDLNRVILDSYHTYMPGDRTPIVVLNIETDPILVDVNVHPTKMDIKFSKFEELKELITKTIEQSLKKETFIPHIALSIPTIERPTMNVEHEKDEEESNPYEEITMAFEIHEELPWEEPRIKKMHSVGIVHGTYIVAENEEGMYLIDQHAAKERINYELVKKEMTEKKGTIDLLIPMSIHLSMDQYLLILDRFDVLNELGLDTEDFGDQTLIIRTRPMWMPEQISDGAIKEIVEIIASDKHFDKARFIDHRVATIACKMSIKANQHISLEEADQLLEDLRNTENPFTCPHGRPTMITYSTYELEKLFKRVMD